MAHIKTTIVGSLPKPSWLAKPEVLWAPWQLEGERLAEGKRDRMVAWWNRKVIDVPLEKVTGRSRTVDPDGSLVVTARALGICLGDS